MVIFRNSLVSLWLLLNWASVNDAQLEDAIVNGTEAYPGQFPNVVSIQNNGSHRCQGSILSTTWILTSASCLSLSTTPGDYQILSGTTTLDSGGARRNISPLIVHPEFVPPRVNNIALARLARPLLLCSRIRPTTLTNVNTTEGTNVTVSGWGSIVYVANTTNPPSNTLQTFNTTTISNANCSQTLRRDIPSTDLCTYTPGQGICSGDSGGALFDVITRQQVGLVASGIPCAREYPDIYTRIFSYVDWIANNTGLSV